MAEHPRHSRRLTLSEIADACGIESAPSDAPASPSAVRMRVSVYERDGTVREVEGVATDKTPAFKLCLRCWLPVSLEHESCPRCEVQ